MRIPKSLVVTAFFLTGCGGVSEERVSSLEQQIKKLQEAQTTPKDGDAVAAVTTKVDGLEASTTERFKKLEDMMELLQRGLTEATAGKPGAAPAAAPSESSADVDSLLGIEAVGVEVSGDSYTVKRDWLVRELKAAALGGKGPKLTPAKPAGVGVKAVKPKSLVDQLGIKNGDIIAVIGDVPVSSVEELSAALKKATSPTSVKIQRKKKEIVLKYTLKD